jgi:ATP-binding cassette subfamily C (CFTR/MRP) protein 1
VVLTDGVISELGTYEQLMSHNGPFARYLTTYLIQHAGDQEEQEEGEEEG